jgi:hypothetical protein
LSTRSANACWGSVRLKVMKAMIWIGITVGGTAGGLVGALFDGGFGLWSISLSTIGSFVGLWAGYKIGKMYF